VCGGLAEYFDVDPTIVRVTWVILSIIAGAVVFGFTPSRFAENFWGGEGETASVWSQIAATMAVTLFVFLGVEGASVYSRYAKERKDVGTATVFGFIGVTCLMILVTMLPYAVMTATGTSRLF